MSILKLLPGPRISEFAKASNGQAFNGTCSQASGAMAFAAATQPQMSQQECIDLMVAMRDAMYARDPNVSDTGCAANGAATYKSMANELRRRGAKVDVEWDYAGDHLPQDWHDLLIKYAGVQPIMLQVANAQALIDTAGTPEDGGVKYHSIYIAGIASEGYVVYDPNNPTVMQTGDIYPYTTASGKGLAAASPCGLIMLAITPTLLPGVTDDGAALTFPSGYTMTQGFRDAWLANQAALGLALMPALDTRDGGSLQVCEHAALRWDGKQVSIVQTTPTLVSWLSKWAQLAAVNDDLQQRQAADQQQITALQGQLASAQANVASLKGTIASFVQDAQDVIKIAGAA